MICQVIFSSFSCTGFDTGEGMEYFLSIDMSIACENIVTVGFDF